MPKNILTKPFWSSLALFLLALLPRITTLDHTFIVNDEPLYWKWSNEFARALLAFDWSGTLVGIGYPSVTVMWVHTLGAGLQFGVDALLGTSQAGVILNQPLIFDMLGPRRLIMGVVNAWLILLIFWRAGKLLEPAIAFFGAGLIAFAPFLLADARTMRGDALMSSLMLLSVLDFLIFLREKRSRPLVTSGIAFGLALLTKMTALPVAGFAGLAVGVYLLRRRAWPWAARLRWGGVTLLRWGGVTAATVFLLWPALWVRPLEVFDFMTNYAAGSLDGRLNFFWGRLTYDEPLPLFYPVAFLFRANPVVVLGVAVVALVSLISVWRLWRMRRDREGRSPQAVLEALWQTPAVARWTLLALGAYSVIYWLVLNVGALKRDRYLMPVFPALMFVAAAGLLWLGQATARRWPGRNLPRPLAAGRWVWAGLFLLVGLEAGHILSTHPFYYTYWSPLLGGGPVAMNAMMAEGGVDSAALVHLNRRPAAAQETAALLTKRDYAPAYEGRSVRLTTQGRWVTADHVVVRQYHYQTQKMEPYLLEYLYRRPPEHLVEFQGYTWAWVYPGPAADYYVGDTLAGQAKLLGYDLSSQTASPDRPLQLKLFWQNQGYQVSEPFFVRLVDAGGFVWADTVARPLPDFEAVVAKREAIVESEARLEIPPGTPPGLYFLKMGVADGEENIDLGVFTLPSDGSRVTVTRPAGQPAVAVDRPIQQKLSRDVTLVGADVETPFLLTPQTPQRLTLYWRAEADVTAEYVVSIRLLDAAGAEAAYWLGHPTHGIHPSSEWQSQELIRDPWLLDLGEAETSQPLPPGNYTLIVLLLQGETGQVLGQAPAGEIELSDRRRLFEAPPLQHQANIRLGQHISLLGYNLSQAPLTGGARLTVKLYWQAEQPVPEDYTVFVQILGPDNTVAGQHDGVPAGGDLPTTLWDRGEIVPDRHQIDFPITQPGQYRIIAGMYDPATGERLPVTTADGTAGGDYWLLDTFTVTDSES